MTQANHDALSATLARTRRAFLVMAAADGVHVTRLRFNAALNYPELANLVPVNLAMICRDDVAAWTAEWQGKELAARIQRRWARHWSTTSALPATYVAEHRTD